MTLPLIKPCRKLGLFMTGSKSGIIVYVGCSDSQNGPNGRTKSQTFFIQSGAWKG